MSLFLFLAASGPAQAVVLDARSGLTHALRPFGETQFYCGPETEPGDLLRPERAAPFLPLNGVLAQGFTRETCWLRFIVQRSPDAPHEWWLEVGMPYLDEVSLFIIHPDGSVNRRDLGDRQPFSARPVPHRLFVFPFTLEDTRPVTAYLRIQSSSTMLVETLDLWQPAGLLARTHRETAWQWSVFGLIALGALTYLVFWLWLREPIYRAYTLYLITLLGLNFLNSGFGSMWLFPDHPLAADRSIGFAVSLALLTGLWFFDQVFALRKNFPRLGRAVPWILWFYGLAALAALTGQWALAAAPVQTVGLGVTLAIGIAGPWLLLRGNRHLRLYVLAFAFQIATVIAALSRNLGLWPLAMSIDHFILAASGLHVVLLNFAIAERMQNLRRERQKLEAAATRLDSEMRALDQQREFMALAAHEFRTPLTIIDTSAQLMASELKQGKGGQAGRIDNIRQAVKRITSLMDEFLTQERIESERRGFNPGEVSLDALLEGALAEFPGHRVQVVRHGKAGRVFVDERLAQIALVNLLGNALRYSPPTETVCLEVENLARGGVQFIVSDRGPGIPADEQPYIFDKYFRGRGTQTQTGAGLGLYLVKRIATLHGGTIKLESPPGMGCRFTLVLPGRAAI